ncbi:glycoside hydrolase family 2 TIM barrel-domain containing protein [Pleomorphomonas sp. JP5]|uniref:glycoside hydrolase family 2 protein n=1 Tax=Pleomorphomonas sp. JP5 TaxID=2942998 RepID=UPI0020432365|nr:glycoside hydrolase family 2 TIM barrel-domain containing protein [Pleomorphomonas sp. JP5]MCM5559896.1 glycoside hydrolase family 2 protein [Pleomorphomonas sp. JP5]
MRKTINCNTGWTFHEGFSADLAAAFRKGVAVNLPHNAVDLPYNYFHETCYQRPFTYQKVIAWRPEFEGREVALVFDGAMADNVVYINGEQVVAHPDGYTPFTARLTERLVEGDNLVTVKIDGSENPAIPPFGGQIDYLTYAGIYRDVWLRLTAPVYIGNVKIETPDVLAAKKTVKVRVDIANPRGLKLAGRVSVTLKDAAGKSVGSADATYADDSVTLEIKNLEGMALWDIDNPNLYVAVVDLVHESGDDMLSVNFGFRSVEFTTEGFRLNGKPLKLRGLNRHQAYPYVGYAMGRRAQELDAELLKNELKVNVVRTSHYPQSPWFLDACDRLGLLVFEEIPGWQHVGDEKWQALAIDNVRAMIERDWNHPSIIIWGVRINESQDFHDFYTATNKLAHELDPTRQTGGVRYITDSEFLEDVYTMNDFIQGNEELPGVNRPRTALRSIGEITGLKKPVPYMVTEFNGHMYPTKRYDQEQRQAEHVTRYLSILNAVYGDPNISGSTGWCMFDYNTHKDFGSGDRICHHGVMDAWREPKFAAWAYTSQCDPDEEVVLKPVTYYARGERNIGGILPLIVLTNCDEVELQYGPDIVKRVKPDRETYPHLPHAPVVIDHRAFSPEELGLWGMKWEEATVTGYVDGKPVKTVKFACDPVPTTLEVAPDWTELSAEPKDSVRVIVRALDQLGNLLPFLDEAIHIEVSGPAKLLGPSEAVLKGGAIGFWLETTGGAGNIVVKVACHRFGETTITLKAG